MHGTCMEQWKEQLVAMPATQTEFGDILYIKNPN